GGAGVAVGPYDPRRAIGRAALRGGTGAGRYGKPLEDDGEESDRRRDQEQQVADGLPPVLLVPRHEDAVARAQAELVQRPALDDRGLERFPAPDALAAALHVDLRQIRVLTRSAGKHERVRQRHLAGHDVEAGTGDLPEDRDPD